MKKIIFLKGSLLSVTLLAASIAGAETKINGLLQNRLETAVTAAIIFNQETDYATWHTSSANFHGIFENVLRNDSLRAQVSLCDAVSNVTVEIDGQAVKQPRPAEHIVLMESEISEPEFAPLFRECKSDLLSKIKNYFEIKVADLYQQYPPISNVALTQVETIVKKYENKNGGVLADAKEVLGENEVIFTFDDGPVVENTVQVLDALKAHNVKAIFFPVGERIKSDAAKLMMKRIKSEGHPIGNHSFTHPGFRKLLEKEGEAACLSQISRTHQVVWDTTGQVYPYFRFPGGTANPQLQAMVNARRLLNWRWNMDPEDFNTPDPAQVVAKAIALFEKKKSGIFLFHDIKRQTAIAIPIILKELLARGAKPTILIPVDSNEVENPHPDLVKKH